MKDIDNILSNEEGFEDEDLLKYLNQNLSPEEAHKLEKAMLQDAFVNDAIEGLSAIKDKEQINKSIDQLNNHLGKILKERTEKKKKRKIPSNQWTVVAIAITLLLVVLGYYVLHLKGFK